MSVMLKKWSTKSQGFTLLELTVVVAIVGVLGVVAGPTYMTYVRAARSTEAISSLKVMAESNAAYFTKLHVDANGVTLSQRFVAGGAMVPAAIIGVEPMPNNQANLELFRTEPSLKALNWLPSHGFYYQYQVQRPSFRNGAIIAQGDLDGDGETSLFKIMLDGAFNGNSIKISGIIEQDPEE
jgi:prepilin-type N-terminal cleavage/methylation domain-containing protein